MKFFCILLIPMMTSIYCNTFLYSIRKVTNSVVLEAQLHTTSIWLMVSQTKSVVRDETHRHTHTHIEHGDREKVWTFLIKNGTADEGQQDKSQYCKHYDMEDHELDILQ